eukprot:2346211-Rhodomonas_salina.1
MLQERGGDGPSESRARLPHAPIATSLLTSIIISQGGASSAAGAGAAVSEPQPPTPKPTLSKEEVLLSLPSSCISSLTPPLPATF